MTDAAATTAPIDVLEDLMAARFSCRAFKPDPVPREVIERILGAAQKTASWCNSQPWQVVITSGEATTRFRDVIYSAAASGAPMSGDFEFPREYRGVYLDRRRESGFQLYNAVGIARGDKAAAAQQALQNFNLFGAPHAAIITTDEALGVYGAVDCGGYVTSFLLAAQALGIATVPQAALAFHAGVVRQHFGLGDDRRVVCGISFGYADPDHKANSYRTNRAALGEVATFVDK
ncbi:nitroreductase [Rhodopseudomonas palustris]|uniref:Nitroreductase n=1 Tax=Rhodopseudomonas palustris (strain DX-1) TaxID=652103 RepID=E6VGY1_RHOPX|nr:nitroreductase [Rhodopseudomonas palustris]QDL96600.1 nitroreductase [Rhodopseudomonas palustris]